MSIRARLLLSFGLILALMALTNGLSILAMHRGERHAEMLYTQNVKTLTQLAKLRFNLTSVRLAAALSASLPKAADRQQAVDQGHQHEAKVLEALEALRALPADDHLRETLQQIEAGVQAYLPVKEDTYQLALQGRTAEAHHNMVTRAKAAFAVLPPLLEQAFQQANGDAETTFGAMQQVSQQGIILQGVMLAIAILVGLALGLLQSGWLSRALGQMAEAARGIARGELDQELRIQGRDELGQMAQSFREMIAYLQEVAFIAQALSQGDLTRTLTPRGPRDRFGPPIARMVEQLQQVVSQVGTAAAAVGEGAGQISGASQQLAEASATQASSTEETSATVAEMTAQLRAMDASAQTVGERVMQVNEQSEQLAGAVQQTASALAELAASLQQVAAHVQQADAASGMADQAAQEGTAAVDMTIQGMAEIQETMGGILGSIQTLEARSGQIGAIIEVIDDIAEQTNLLALNAAIEAARAGEAGRGFAVVADEVRKLAERSTQATREIAALIQGVQQETRQAVQATETGARTITRGAELSQRTGQALQRIRSASQEVATLLATVNASTQEQAGASRQLVGTSQAMATINDQVAAAIAAIAELTRTVTHATAEQRQGAEQLALTVAHLSRTAQEAASATSQVHGTADDLEHEAARLRQAMGFFRLEGAPSVTALALR